MLDDEDEEDGVMQRIIEEAVRLMSLEPRQTDRVGTSWLELAEQEARENGEGHLFKKVLH